MLYRNARYRVILATDDMGRAYPGFCRLIWTEHVAEMTDLSENDQREVLTALLAVESAVREVLNPDKINLASFGNMVPHLHWHVIPRWQNDAAFPGSVWSPVVRPGTVPRESLDSLAARLTTALVARLGPGA